MTNFEFQEVFSLLGKKTDDPSAREFFENIHKNYKDFFIVHEPFEENIEKENDNWKTYDSEELGITIEVLGDLVISVSFQEVELFTMNHKRSMHILTLCIMACDWKPTRKKSGLKWVLPRKKAIFLISIRLTKI